jgi:hypothetical protein
VQHIGFFIQFHLSLGIAEIIAVLDFLFHRIDGVFQGLGIYFAYYIERCHNFEFRPFYRQPKYYTFKISAKLFFCLYK